MWWCCSCYGSSSNAPGRGILRGPGPSLCQGSSAVGRVTSRLLDRSIEVKLRSGSTAPSRVFSLAAPLLPSHPARPSLCRCYMGSFSDNALCHGPTLQALSRPGRFTFHIILGDMGVSLSAVLARLDRLGAARCRLARNVAVTEFSEIRRVRLPRPVRQSSCPMSGARTVRRELGERVSGCLVQLLLGEV